MSPNSRFILRFYFPLVSGISLIPLAFFLDYAHLVKVSTYIEGNGLSMEIIKTLLKFSVNQDGLLRIIVLIAAFFLIFWAFNVDFSKYVPKRLRVKAYFRVVDIEKKIEEIFSKEQQKGSFESSWKDLLSTYDDERFDRLEKFWKKHNKSNIPARYEITRDITEAEGETFFSVKRHKMLSYEMLKCAGYLKFEVMIQHREPFHFTETFELLKTHDIKPKFHDLFRLFPGIILKPEFRQNFSIDDEIDSPHDHTIVAMTRLTLLPFPELSSTLYLWKMDDGSLIPIGYGNYYELSDEIG